MARYDNSFDNIQVLFDKEDLRNTLGETLSRYGMTQLRIAETEKYPHVSFSFLVVEKKRSVEKSEF